MLNKRVLVVEDDSLLARELAEEIECIGALVVGPARTVAQATALVRTERLDAALLDVNLGGELVFPVADALAQRGTPLLFVTGYDAALIPHRFGQFARREKPADPGLLVRELKQAIRPPWLIALGASGEAGLTDLQHLLHVLPVDLNAIVMAVLHRPWGSRSSLREILQRDSGLPVEVAQDLQQMSAGRVYLGEPSHHLRLGWGACADMIDDPHRAYPNRTVDLLFNSLARNGAGRTMGAILSGSLDDGSLGLAAMQADGGLAMTVPGDVRGKRGMARNAATHVGKLDFIGSAAAIGAEIERIVRANPFANLHAERLSRSSPH